ncbi:hypothetical protein RPMD05_25 [Rhodobacteraceae phage LS06-2018-MD05]|nr:hypothetical protein RPMD05_25 [Rhodobacteraceae phage LS06-2018-MD05]
METKEIKEKMIRDAKWDIEYHTQKLEEAKAKLSLLEAI